MRTMPFSLLTILCLLMAVTPAMASYDNGSINGTTDAWTINFGFTLSDSYTSSGAGNTLNIGVWLFPGDSLGSVDIDFGSTSFASNYGHVGGAAANLVSDLGVNQYGYDIREYSFNLGGVNTGPGSGFVTLGNAVETVFGDPVYWDENSGPSSAYENSIGSITSEAFTLSSGCGAGDPDCGPPIPEPSSIMLLGSGILGIAGILRRRLNR